MRGLPEIPPEDVAEYWQLVRDALVASGVSKREAARMAKAYREYMKPASWTIYNRDPEDSAEMAKSYDEWMRKEAEQAAKANGLPKRTKKPAKTADTLPMEEEIAQLPRRARVAFAARCARRVEPLFKHRWPAAPENHVLAVKRAVEVAEQFAAAAADAAAADAADAANTAAADAAYAAAAARAAANAYAARAAANAYAAKAVAYAAIVLGEQEIPVIRRDFQRVFDESRARNWTDTTPVPPAVFGPLWPEGPPADWPELPKPTKFKLTVRVPDSLPDGVVIERLTDLSAALARLNVAGGGHGLELVRPIDFTQEQDKGRADVVEQEAKKKGGRGHAQGGREHR